MGPGNVPACPQRPSWAAHRREPMQGSLPDAQAPPGPVNENQRIRMKCVDDFRLRFGKQELVPIVIGGMGVDISTAELALEVARLGGIGHISDAMVQTVSDTRFDTNFVSQKLKQYKANVASSDKTGVHFNLAVLEE